MSYRWYGRGRGIGPRYRRGYNLSYREYGQALGFRKGFGSNTPIQYQWVPRTQDRWMMNQRFPNIRSLPAQSYTSYQQQPPSQHNQPSTFSYPYTQQGMSSNYQQTSKQTTMTHMNCAHFRNGFCSLKGISVDPNGPACQNFAPR
jgi:hypothetical protein